MQNKSRTWPRSDSKNSSTKKSNKGKNSTNNKPSKWVRWRTTKSKDSTLRSMNSRRNKLKSREKKLKRRKSLSNSMNNRWRIKSKGEKDKNKEKLRTIKTSKQLGMINWRLWRKDKTMMKNSERICMLKMRKNSSDRWRRNKTRDSRSWGRSFRLTRRPKLLSRSRKDNSRATLKNAWRNGNPMVKTFTLSSNTCRPPWKAKVDWKYLLNNYILQYYADYGIRSSGRSHVWWV